MNITNKRSKALIEFFNGLNNYEIELLLNIVSERISVPVSKGEFVECQEGLFFGLNGTVFELYTKEFHKECIEKSKKE